MTDGFDKAAVELGELRTGVNAIIAHLEALDAVDAPVDRTARERVLWDVVGVLLDHREYSAIPIIIDMAREGNRS